MASSDKKTILIVGLGMAGTAALQALVKSKNFPSSTHRIVAVHPQTFSYWPIGGLRAAVVPGFEDKVFGKLDPTVLGLPADQGHLFLTGSQVVDLDLIRKVATLSQGRAELGGSNKIPYDRVIIATGSEYGVPMRVPDEATTPAKAKAALRSMQASIAASNRVLVVGAGAVGLEFAGEVAAAYPGAKEITIIDRSERLFADPKWKKGLGDKLEAQLEKLGVRVLHNTKADVGGLETGPVPEGRAVTIRGANGTTKTITPDYLFLATGNTPATSLFDDSLLDPKTHRLLVRADLSLPGYPSAFSLGDVMNRDAKVAAAIDAQAAVVAQNLLADVTGAREGAKRAVQKDSMNAILVPLGPSGGVAQIFGFTPQAWFASRIKGKTLFTDKFFAKWGELDA